MMKFVAIIEYTTKVQAGAIVRAKNRVDAWKKLLKSADDGNGVSSIHICEVLPDMELRA